MSPYRLLLLLFCLPLQNVLTGLEQNHLAEGQRNVEKWVAKGMSGEEHCMSQASSPLLPTNYKHPYKAIYFSENHVHAVSSKNVCINDKFYNTPNMAPCKLAESTLFLPKKRLQCKLLAMLT